MTSCSRAATRDRRCEALLPRVPDAFRVIVVDNGSTDDTAEVARAPRRHGRDRGAGPGTAPRCTPGLEAATAEYVAFMDGDGSFDPDELRAAAGRRPRRAAPTWRSAAGVRPSRGVWPWHARAGNALVCGLAAAPDRACRPTTSRRCASCRRAGPAGPRRRRTARFGYPVELLQRAMRGAAGGSPSTTSTYHPRAEGTRSKVSGSVRGTLRTARDFARVLS